MSEKCHQRKWPTSFDHLVGAGQQGGRYGEAHCLCGLEVDDHLELRRRLNGKIGWISSFLLSRLILNGFHAAAVACSRVQRNRSGMKGT
jgi:hypothetical protein